MGYLRHASDEMHEMVLVRLVKWTRLDSLRQDTGSEINKVIVTIPIYFHDKYSAT